MQSAPRILVVEHEATCPPARVGVWLAEAGCRLEISRPYQGESLPADLEAYDALLVLGGTMGADDEDLHPWLAPVKELIRDAVRDDLPVLGICLGHQLVAVALGGEVRPNPLGQQLGLLETRWLPEAVGDPLVGGLAATVSPPARGIQWNNDVVTLLPEGTTVLAQTERDEIQVARFAASAWGLQLHPEADVDVVRTWAEEDADRHLRQGIDTDELLRAIELAHEELAGTWRPVVQAFARLAADDWSTG